MTESVTVRDGYGTLRTGPRGAWWLPIKEGSDDVGARPRAEIPAFRLRAWNLAAVAYAAAAVVLMWRHGHLAVFLAVVAVMVAVTACGLVLISRRRACVHRAAAAPDMLEEHRRVAAFLATRRSVRGAA